MNFDLFAFWAGNQTSMDQIPDYYCKQQYLLTREGNDARKTYQNSIKSIPDLSKMSSFEPKPSIIESLPLYSFFSQFEFSMATPFLSKDDAIFHICNNPVRKDKVFKVPMISGSSWKGNIRWTAMKLFENELPEKIDRSSIEEYLRRRAQLVRLFGYEKDAIEDYIDNLIAQALVNAGSGKLKDQKELIKNEFAEFLKGKGYVSSGVEGRRGRLNFYPTFLNSIGLEVINPHDRKTKAGTLPIYIESVPAEAHGVFSLLYVPFDLIGKKSVEAEVVADLRLIERAVRSAMLTYGFSAKKGDGFGIASYNLKKINVKIKGVAIEDKTEPGKEPKKVLKSFAELRPVKPENESGNFDTLCQKINALISAMQGQL